MKIEHFALNVKDPPAMAHWYSENLGMRIVRAGAPPVHTTFLADESGSVMVEIYCNTAATIPDYASMDPLLVHIAFMAVGDIKEQMARLVAAGATVYSDVGLTPAGDELAMLRDPWGLAIQIARRRQPMI